MKKKEKDKRLDELREEADKAFFIYYRLLWDKPPASYEICEKARVEFEKKLKKYYDYKHEEFQ